MPQPASETNTDEATTPPPTQPQNDTTAIQSRRVSYILVGVIVVILGLVSRFALSAPFGDIAGGLFYAFLVYIVVALIIPRSRLLVVAGIALAINLTIELLQLTGIPAAVAQVFPPAPLVFGTTFMWTDLLIGFAGIVIATATDAIGRVTTGRQGSRVSRRQHR